MKYLIIAILSIVSQTSLSQKARTMKLNGIYVAKQNLFLFSEKRHISGTFKKGYAKFIDKTTNKFGIIDKKGSIILESKFDIIAKLYENYFCATLNQKVGVYDTNGTLVVPHKYQWINPKILYNKIIISNSDGKFGMIDIKGNEILTTTYDNIDIVAHYIVATKDSEIGVFSESDKPVYSCNCVLKTVLKSEKSIQLYDGEKFIIIDSTSKPIFSSSMPNETGRFSDGLMIKKEGSNFGAVDYQGKFVIPPKFLLLGDFKENLAYAGIRGESGIGFIDTSGKLVIPYMYSSANSFQNNLSVVLKNEKYGIINKQGKIIVPIIYNEIGDPEEGLYPIALNTKKGVINSKGKIILKMSYKQVDIYSDENIIAIKNIFGKNGFANLKGEIIIPFKYDDVLSFVDGLAIVFKGSHTCYINVLGEETN